jgi:hypothetical protein
MTKLTELGLDGLAITDAGLDQLRELKTLASLALRATKVTAVGVQKLATALPNCRIEWDGGTVQAAMAADRKAAEYVLSIGGKVTVNVKGKPVGAKVLADLPGEPFTLQGVNLGGNKKLDDAGMAIFKDCANLEEFEIHDTKVTNDGFANIKGCTRLRILNLTGSRVTDAAMRQVGTCDNLTYLLVTGTQVTDAGLAHLKDCKKLTTFHGHRLPITDTGLAHLAAVRTLTLVGVSDSKVTAEGVKALQTALPNCKVNWDGNTADWKK